MVSNIRTKGLVHTWKGIKRQIYYILKLFYLACITYLNYLQNIKNYYVSGTNQPHIIEYLGKGYRKISVTTENHTNPV